VDEFDDVFSPLLNSTDKFWALMADNLNADFLASITALVVFAQGEVEQKISFLFQMINGDKTMSRPDVLRFFQVVIAGVCGICGLAAPSQLGLHDFTQEAFKSLDNDGNGTVSPVEFEQWIAQNDTI
jgi:Ca2+-binding EF-hand superfamily protein